MDLREKILSFFLDIDEPKNEKSPSEENESRGKRFVITYK